MKVLVFLLTLITPLAMAEGPAFSQLSIDQALAKAGKEKKIVYVDFYTTWCGPCKMMDRKTFPDPAVVKWLQTHTVAIKIDAEAQADISKRYKIDGYPTSMLIAPDGKEIGRLLGFRSPETLVPELDLIKKGLNPAQRDLDKLAKDPMNFDLRMKVAHNQRKDKEASFKAYKAIVDDLTSGAMKEGSLNFVYSMISMIDSEASRAYQAEVAKSLKAQIVAGDTSKETVGKFAAIAPKEQGALPLYEELIAAKKSPDELKGFHDFIANPLRESHRYADLERISPLVERIAKARTNWAELRKTADPEMLDPLIRSEVQKFYEECIGQKRFAEADQLTAEFLPANATAGVLNGFAWSAFLAGSKREVDLGYALKAYTLSNSAPILDTYAQLLHLNGQTAKAIKLVEDALAKQPSEDDKQILLECLDAINAEDNAKPRG